jgi:hypothetical protein
MYLRDRSTYRRISDRTGLSPAAILRYVQDGLDHLEFLNPHHACGVVLMDAKALSIKGQDFCEYLIWDIEAGLIARRLCPGSESSKVYDDLLDGLTARGLIITSATTDGLPGFRRILDARGIVQQRCQVHLLRELRSGLQLTLRHRHKCTTPSNRQKSLLYRYALLFLQATPETWDAREHHCFRHGQHNLFGLNPIQFQAYRRFLSSTKRAFQHYFEDPRIQPTTNRLELYIHHFATRLATMNGFKNAENADRILIAIHTDLLFKN